jgi:hypothetical protein
MPRVRHTGKGDMSALVGTDADLRLPGNGLQPAVVTGNPRASGPT